MESIKHKMMCLQRETSEAYGKSHQLQDEGNTYIKEAARYEKLVIEINKEINRVEDNLDSYLTSFKEMSEKLEVTNKEGNDYELQVSALKRRIALVEEERGRISEKQTDSENKLEEYQQVTKLQLRFISLLVILPSNITSQKI